MQLYGSPLNVWEHFWNLAQQLVTVPWLISPSFVSVSWATSQSWSKLDLYLNTSLLKQTSFSLTKFEWIRWRHPHTGNEIIFQQLFTSLATKLCFLITGYSWPAKLPGYSLLLATIVEIIFYQSFSNIVAMLVQPSSKQQEYSAL